MAEQFAPQGDPFEMFLANGGVMPGPRPPQRQMPLGMGGPVGPPPPPTQPAPPMQLPLGDWLFGMDPRMPMLRNKMVERTEQFAKQADQDIAARRADVAKRKVGYAEKSKALADKLREEKRLGGQALLQQGARQLMKDRGAFETTQDMLFSPDYTPSPQEMLQANAQTPQAQRQVIPSVQQVNSARGQAQAYGAQAAPAVDIPLMYSEPLAPPPPAASPQPQFQAPAQQPNDILGALGQQPSYLEPQVLKAAGRPFRMASPRQ